MHQYLIVFDLIILVGNFLNLSLSLFSVQKLFLKLSSSIFGPYTPPPPHPENSYVFPLSGYLELFARSRICRIDPLLHFFALFTSFKRSRAWKRKKQGQRHYPAELLNRYCSDTTEPVLWIPDPGYGIRCFFYPWIRDKFFPDPGSNPYF